LVLLTSRLLGLFGAGEFAQDPLHVEAT
jgi:hypothetical protein